MKRQVNRVIAAQGKSTRNRIGFHQFDTIGCNMLHCKIALVDYLHSRQSQFTGPS
jgi:hypothetical protein